MNYEAYFKISYGLFVIGTQYDGKANGYIANTAFQVTAEPPKLAISCNKDNYSAEMIKKSKSFSISVLSINSKPEIIGTFGYKSGKDIDKFSAFKYQTGKTNSPILTEDCIAFFECELVDTFDVGSHYIFIGEVIDGDVLDESQEPITYAFYRNVRKGVAPKNAPTYIDKSKTEKTKQSDSYKCIVCGYLYNPENGDPEGGIAPGTKFEDIPDDWTCPLCGASKDVFEII